jgi:twinfilin-like protein
MLTGISNFKQAAAPLTFEEEEKKRERESGAIYTGGASSYIHGVAFPTGPGVVEALNEFTNGQVNYLQLGVDASKESITLGKSSTIDIGDFSAQVPRDVPAFHFFRWQHEHDDNSIASIVYVFSCPDGSGGTTSAPVKLRMLYSASKANVEGIITSAGNAVALKLEINAPDEVSEDLVRVALHPPPVEEKKAFAKPKRAGTGTRRLIRDKN